MEPKCPKCGIGTVTSTGSTKTGMTCVCHLCGEKWTLTWDEYKQAASNVNNRAA